LPSTDLEVCGSTVPWSDSVKYLGVFLDKNLLFANHIEYVLLKTEKIFRIFYSIFNRKSKMNTKEQARALPSCTEINFDLLLSFIGKLCSHTQEKDTNYAKLIFENHI
jgi:hypothetical protein